MWWRTLKQFMQEAAASLLPVVTLVFLLSLMTEHTKSELIIYLAATVFVYAGLVLFLLGSRASLIPMGRLLGAQLPRLGTLPRVALTALAIGLIMTFAEPDIWMFGKLVDSATNGAIAEKMLVSTVATGVGLFMSLGIMRLIKGFPIKRTLLIGYGVVVLMALFSRSSFVAYAFDSSAVTTGPVAIPFVLAIGAGLSEVLAGRHTLSDSFGLIGVTSLGPIITVFVLGMMAK